MAQAPRRYRKKPFAVYEHGTRIYAPTKGEDCYRVIAADAAAGKRPAFKFAREDDARAKAREFEAFLASRTPLYGTTDGDRTVGALASAYMRHPEGCSGVRGGPGTARLSRQHHRASDRGRLCRRDD